MHDDGKSCAQMVAALAQQTQGVPASAPCCAWCAGIKLDCTVPPESPRKLLRRGRGCATSIVAYMAAREHMKGKTVDIQPVPGKVPALTVDGEPVDPLKHYGAQACGCPTEAA